jgi:cellulose 1,4-beta-cellobiosidase
VLNVFYRWGEIGSTYTGSSITSTSKPVSTGTSSSTSKPVSTTTKTTSSPPSTTGVAQWGQCGGIGYSGSTTCASPYTCHKVNDCKSFSHAQYE